MKALATITGENGERITISYDATAEHLYTESFGEPTMEVGPRLATEQAASEWIQDSYGRTNWQLTWIDDDAEVSR